MEHLLISFLQKNNVFSFDQNDLKLQLLSHNEYPSFKAITDTLDYFNIENVAAIVPKDALGQLPQTFLALIEYEGLPELVLVEQKKAHVLCTDKDKKKKKMTSQQFQELWNGTLVAIELEEKPSSIKKLKLSTPIVTATIASLALITAISIGNYSAITIVYVGLSSIGAFISYLIAKEELGITDAVTSKVCGAITGGNKGCSNVINSREGKIFGSVGLGDLSLLFFITMLLGAIFLKLSNTLLLAIAAVTIPVVIYAVGTQVIKLKQFCMLCIGISAVLVFQFVLLVTTVTSWNFSFIETLQILALGSLITSIWFTIKKFWKRTISLSRTEQEYYRFKRTPLFFKEAFGRTKSYNTQSLANSHRITFGNPYAPIKIQAITNPFCGFCKKPFEIYTKLLETYPKEINVELIFNVSPDTSNDATKLTMKIIELYENDASLAFSALIDWFAHKNLETWNEKYSQLPTKSLTPSEIINTHYQWCEINELFHTPETLINGKSFPTDYYDISDIALFLEELKEPMSPSIEKIEL